MSGRVTRIGVLSLAIALAAVSAPGELLDTGGETSLAPTASAHVCVEPPQTEWQGCTHDDCGGDPLVRHLHFKIWWKEGDVDFDGCSS